MGLDWTWHMCGNHANDEVILVVVDDDDDDDDEANGKGITMG
jgi:hypothetical protein